MASLLDLHSLLVLPLGDLPKISMALPNSLAFTLFYCRPVSLISGFQQKNCLFCNSFHIISTRLKFLNLYVTIKIKFSEFLHKDSSFFRKKLVSSKSEKCSEN